MSIVVNTNVASLNAQRLLSKNTTGLNRSLERLASGYRINRASDDAAGLQISENLRTQIRGSQKALDNVQDGINVLNIVDGAYNVITDNLQRMRELAVQAANDTLGAAQRNAIEDEMDQLALEITRISDATQFNNIQLMDGSAAAFNIQLGPNAAAATNSIDLTTAGGVNPFADTDATALAVADGNIVVTTTANAQAAITSVDTALGSVNTIRSTIGAFTNRLESAAENLSISIENMSSSESRLRNVDVATESANLVKNQILQQASATILAQANQIPGLALQLIGG